MIKNGYASRNIPSFAKFEDTYNSRISAKKAGDKTTANNLKLVLNTCYGATLNQYNDLYDPLQARSVCISGQLYLSELANHLYTEVSGLKICSLNTDGIMVEFDDSHYEQVLEITSEWQERTGFELEEDKIKKVCQANVNNYILVMEDGSVKTKGGYLVRGIAPAGAFNVNNNATIVAKAIVEYFVNGTPPEETINNCDDIFAFQIIAKAGSKYKEAYHIVDGEKLPVQKVNRVYATADERYGKLFKVKAENDSTAKIEMLPEHCIIDNDNQLTIDAVDKTFYIEMARKRINDFLGIKPEKNKRRTSKMATTTTAKDKTLNVYQKLLKARGMFLDHGAKKSGKNMHLAFKYFELDDIVPVATKIFEEVGLISVANFTSDTATMTVVNVEDGEDSIVFTAPFNQIAPIVSNAGKQATNEMQALGSSITYMRRYLYMIALDICEPDGIEPTVGTTPPARAVIDKAINETPVQNTASSPAPLTNSNSNATSLQIRQLKDTLIKLKEADPSKEEMITQIAVQTEGFTVISKADCEALIVNINKMLNGELPNEN